MIVISDDSGYHLPSCRDISSNDIVITTSAIMSPLINHQAAPSPYCCPNTFSISYFVCGMADPIS